MGTVVVGVEGTEGAERALDRALLEAQRGGHRLQVVRAWQAPVWIGAAMGQVYDYDVFAAAIASADAAKEQANDLVAKARTSLPSEPPVDVVIQVEEGPPGQVLVTAAQDAALLVVGGRVHNPLTGALFGTTTSHVLHHSSCPVMVVPDEGVPAGPFHRVVVALDGSDASRSALRWGHRAAKDAGCPLVAVHVWLMTSLPNDPHVLFGADPDAFAAAARTWLAQEVHEVVGDDVEVQCLVLHGTPSREILSVVDPSDLLVVGSRGRGGFAGLHLGSVSSQCARHTRSVVTVVRAREERLEG